jgi:phosphoglycolate phosphatase
MRPVAAVVFDLDGTLIDSTASILETVQAALDKTGRAPAPVAALRRHLSGGSRALCARAAGLAARDPELDVFVAEYQALYLAHAVPRLSLMPGARELLDALSESPLALCTNRPRVSTDAVLRHLGVARRFRSVVAGGDVAELKPSALPLLAVAHALGAQPEQLVMVGDSPDDVRAAARCGARSIAFTGGGVWTRSALAPLRPSCVVDRLDEVRAELRRMTELGTLCLK